jgi:hypothetical protein
VTCGAGARRPQTAFAQAGGGRIGAARDAGWAETPQDRLLRLSAAAAAGPAALPQPAAAAGAGAVAGVMDAYNSGHRAKTLLQRHQERMAVRLSRASMVIVTQDPQHTRGIVHGAVGSAGAESLGLAARSRVARRCGARAEVAVAGLLCWRSHSRAPSPRCVAFAAGVCGNIGPG